MREKLAKTKISSETTSSGQILDKKPVALGAPGSGNYTGVANIRSKRENESHSSAGNRKSTGDRSNIYKPNLTSKTKEAGYFVSGGTG
jgi:hypothetical protein